jgi:hypothetical protein
MESKTAVWARSWHMIWLIASVAITLGLVALADLPVRQLVSVVLYILAIPLCGGVALLRQVDRLERDKATPDAIEALARVAMLWPVMTGMMPVGVMLR